MFYRCRNIYRLTNTKNPRVLLNLIPRLSHLTALGGKMRDPGNEVGFYSLYFEKEPLLRLLKCLSIPTQAAQRVGP